MPVFSGNRRPGTVGESLGLGVGGGVVSAPATSMNGMVAGGAMGNLTDMAIERKRAGGELGGPMQANQAAFFNNKKKKRNANGGFTDETSGLEGA